MLISSKLFVAAAFLLSGAAASGQVASQVETSVVQTTKEIPTQRPNRAVIEFSVNFMRENPDYAAELGNQALMGTVVETLDTSSYWVKIKTPDPYTAWVNDMGLVPMSGKEIEDYLEAPKYICTAESSRIYEEPSEDSRIVSEFVMGDIVRIKFKTESHLRDRRKGCEERRAVLTKKFFGVVLPSGKTGYVPSEDVEVFHEWAEERLKRALGDDGFGEDIVATALKFLGVPYMWGGTSIKNVDCSGLSRSVYFSNGVLLPRNASQQARVGRDVPIFNHNDEVSWGALAPGDLIFWGRAETDSAPERISHVGIYIGEGKFVHSSEIVRINSLDSSAADFYERRPVRARRIIESIDKPGTGIISTRRSPDYFDK